MRILIYFSRMPSSPVLNHTCTKTWINYHELFLIISCRKTFCIRLNDDQFNGYDKFCGLWFSHRVCVCMCVCEVINICVIHFHFLLVEVNKHNSKTIVLFFLLQMKVCFIICGQNNFEDHLQVYVVCILKVKLCFLS